MWRRGNGRKSKENLKDGDLEVEKDQAKGRREILKKLILFREAQAYNAL